MNWISYGFKHPVLLMVNNITIIILKIEILRFKISVRLKKRSDLFSVLSFEVGCTDSALSERKNNCDCRMYVQKNNL